MQDESTQPRRIDPRLKLALSHPKRIEILGHLTHGRQAASDSQLAEAAGLTLPQAEYHLKVLHDVDLIAQIEDRQERGKTERSYVAAGRR